MKPCMVPVGLYIYRYTSRGMKSDVKEITNAWGWGGGRGGDDTKYNINTRELSRSFFTLNGLYSLSAFLTSGHSKRLTILPHIHPFIHTFTHRPRSQPRKATASSSGAVKVRCLAQGHLDTLALGRAGDRTSNLPVTSLL